MGGAAVASRNEPSCAYWNPAGLTGIKGFQFESQYTVLSQGRFLSALSLAGALKRETYFGFTFMSYSAGSDLEIRTGPTYDPEAVVGNLEMAFLLSLAAKLDRDWSLGGSLKLFVNALDDLSGIGFGNDLGVQRRLSKKTTVGFMVQDPISFLSYSDGPTEFFPTTLRLGVSHSEEKWGGKGTFDLEWSQDLGLRPRGGVEWRPFETLALRGGAWIGGLTGEGAGDILVRFTGGLGITIPTGDNGLLEFGYSVLPDGLVTGGLLHQVSLKGKFL
jgi:hypothetical protein